MYICAVTVVFGTYIGISRVVGRYKALEVASGSDVVGSWTTQKSFSFKSHQTRLIFTSHANQNPNYRPEPTLSAIDANAVSFTGWSLLSSLLWI